MWTLFKLLFSKKYWRALFHGETWRRTRVSLARAHKDPRARKQLRGVLVLVLAPFLCVGYVLWVIGAGEAGLTGVVLGGLVLTCIVLYRRRRPVEQSGPLTLKIAEPVATPAEREPEFRDTPELRRELAERALLLAVLADRAGSERFLHTKVLPEGMEVVTRRRHLDVLREYGVYERLGASERHWLLLPDGHWPPPAIDPIALSLEPLRLLRWVLGVDSFLPTVGSTMKADFRLANTLITEPRPLFEAPSMIGVDSLRRGITAASQYFDRCFSEGVRRGFYHGQNEDAQQQAIAYANRMHGSEGEDLLLGTVIVSKAMDHDVQLAATLALRRLQVLNWVRGRAFGAVQPEDEVRGFYIPEPPTE